MGEVFAADRGQFDSNSGCEQGLPVSDRTLITARQTCYSASFLNLPYEVFFEGGKAIYERTSSSAADMPGQIVRGVVVCVCCAR